MTSLELEALRHQVEEDYKMDIAAIERLQRRFNTGGNTSRGGSAAERQAAPATETNVVALPQGHEGRESRETREPRGQQAAPDELTESLRSMFSSYRK